MADNSHVRLLVDMGFSRGLALAALQDSHNNFELALDWLSNAAATNATTAKTTNATSVARGQSSDEQLARKLQQSLEDEEHARRLQREADDEAMAARMQRRLRLEEGNAEAQANTEAQASAHPREFQYRTPQPSAFPELTKKQRENRRKAEKAKARRNEMNETARTQERTGAQL